VNTSIVLGSLSCFFIVGITTLPSYRFDHSSDEIHEWVLEMFYYFGAVVNGFGASLLTVGFGSYVANCSVHHYRGYYFGLFNSFFYGTWFFTYIFCAILVKKKENNYTLFFISMSILALISSLSFGLLKKPFIPSGQKMDEHKICDKHEYFSTFNETKSTIIQNDSMFHNNLNKITNKRLKVFKENSVILSNRTIGTPNMPFRSPSVGVSRGTFRNSNPKND